MLLSFFFFFCSINKLFSLYHFIQIPEERARTRHFNGERPKSRHGEVGHELLLFETINRIKVISEKHDIPMVDLALRWPLHEETVKSVIVGATKVPQVNFS